MLALLALSSPALAYSVCTGEDCCLSGDTDHGKVCVLARGEKVLAPDGRSMVDIHVVQKRKKGKQTGTYSGGGDILFHGLADADGAVLIPPRYDGFFEPIGPRAVLATRAGGPLLLVTPEGEAPAGFIRTESVGLSHGVVLRFAVTKVGGDGRLDIAPLHADGSLGDPIYGVLAPGGHRAIVSLGDVAVVTIAESPNGPRGSIFVDVTGAQWSPGREVMTLAEVSPSDKAPTMHAFIDVGPSPIGPVGPMPRLLVPIESSGRPVALSPAVVGVVPLEIVPPRGARREVQVVSWAVVVRAEGGFTYRMAPDPNPVHLAGRVATLPVLDEIRLAFPNHPMPGDESGVLVGHRLDGLWATSSTMDGTNRAPEYDGVGATPESASWEVYAWNAVLLEREKARDKEELARREARIIARDNHDAAVAAAQYDAAKAYYAENKARCLADDWMVCSRVEAAAVTLGDPSLTEWLSKNNTFHTSALTAERVCHLYSRSACVQAERIEEHIRASAAAIEAEKAAFWARVRARQQQILNPSVNVTVYDGGRVQTQTMSMDEYTERY